MGSGREQGGLEQMQGGDSFSELGVVIGCRGFVTDFSRSQVHTLLLNYFVRIKQREENGRPGSGQRNK